jgi:hypothetical protein
MQLAVPGCPKRKVSWRGVGGTWASPREALILSHDNQKTGKTLRGIARDLIAAGRNWVVQFTPGGLAAFNAYNRAIADNGVVLARTGQPPVPFKTFEPGRVSVLSHVKGKRATLTELRALLGEDAEAFWAELKKQDAEKEAKRARINAGGLNR